MERREEERRPRAGQGRAAPRREEPPAAQDERSLGDLLRELTTETRMLVRQEIRLAKVELTEMASQAGRSGGLLAAGGFVAYAGFLTILAGLGFLLSRVMPVWLSFSLVGLVVLLIGYALYRSGLNGLRDTDFTLERTTETLQEDTQWMKEEAQDVKRDPSRLGAQRT